MKNSKNWYLALAVCVLVIFLNIAARCSSGFADWYVRHIFPIWTGTYGRLTGLFPFSVGEWLLYGFALLTAGALVGGVVLVFCRIFTGKRPGKRTRKFYAGYGWLFLTVCLIMTLNCFLLYHTSPLSETMLSEGEQRDFTVGELTAFRDELVEEANRLAVELDRDETGTPVYSGNVKETAVEQMQALGEWNPQFSGFYPYPKGLFLSGFYSQQNILGYYFPFSMEANYNTKMAALNQPATFCHELAHLKGILREDEAGFIGYLACVTSEEPYFQYSGILSVINYVDRDFRNNVSESVYHQHVAISPQVKADHVFLTAEAWEEVEQTALLPTQLVSDVSYQFLDTNLVLNGVEEGIANYSEVVQLLLLNYYTETVGKQ